MADRRGHGSSVSPELNLETERLGLRPLTAPDVDDLHRLFTQPGVRRFLWDDEVIPRERTAAVVERSTASFVTHGFGLWVVSLKDAVPLVGFCGFWHFHDPPQLELLYGLGEEQWHQGLATEAANAMIRYGFDVLGFARIEASTDVANTASVRVMERAGMRFWKREMTNGLDTIYYGIDRDSFATNTRTHE
jgi:[ribosomal protein S5]-alanine N-acetyltransferase